MADLHTTWFMPPVPEEESGRLEQVSAARLAGLTESERGPTVAARPRARREQCGPGD